MGVTHGMKGQLLRYFLRDYPIAKQLAKFYISNSAHDLNGVMNFQPDQHLMAYPEYAKAKNDVMQEMQKTQQTKVPLSQNNPVQAFNWYQRLKLAEVKTAEFRGGEFWIQDGQALFADGDIGDYNHEAYVIEMVQQSYNETNLDWDAFKKQIAQQQFQIALNDAETPQEKLLVQEKWNEDDGEEFLMMALRELGMTNDEYSIAEGTGDARLYAIQHLGWQRLMGTNVETWTLTNNDLRNIANGLWSAYDEDVESETYDIDVHSPQMFFRDVPWEDISSEDVTNLLKYKDQ